MFEVIIVLFKIEVFRGETILSIIVSFAGCGKWPRCGQRRGARWVQCLNQVVRNSRRHCGGFWRHSLFAPQLRRCWPVWLWAGRRDARSYGVAQRYWCRPPWLLCVWVWPDLVRLKLHCARRLPHRGSNGWARCACLGASSCLTGRCRPCGFSWVSGSFIWPIGWRYYLTGNCARGRG